MQPMLFSFHRACLALALCAAPALAQQDPATLSYSPDTFRGQATHLVNLRAGVQISGFDISLFANNLFDSHPRLTRNNLANGALLFFSTTFTPRTIGLTGTYKF